MSEQEFQLSLEELHEYYDTQIAELMHAREVAIQNIKDDYKLAIKRLREERANADRKKRNVYLYKLYNSRKGKK